MKNTKALSTIFKVLTCAVSVATLTLFFFSFVKVGDFFSLTGFQAAFGSTQTVGKADVTTYKSAWYMFAFILSALTVVFSGVNFKVKGTKYATFGFSIATFINIIVLFLANPLTKYFDVRVNPADAISVKTSQLGVENPFMFAVIAAGVAMILATVTMFVSDYSEVLESKGAKISIFRRIKRFFKDYKREIKNIVWPTRSTVFKNVVVVIVMCVVVGAYIWVLDFGLSSLLKLVLGM